MAGRGALSKGGIFSVWKVLLLTALFALTVAAGQKGLSVSVSGGFNDETRGVVIVFAKNSQLDAVLSSISQIQGAYDNKFSEDRVFYSDKVILDEFKALTSNLTQPGRAYYENGKDESAAMRGEIYSDAHAPVWLGLVYELCSFGAGFEIDWLDLFRNAAYLKVADYISCNLMIPAPSLPTPPDPYFEPEPVYSGFGADVESLDLSSLDLNSLYLDKFASSASLEVAKKSGVFYLVDDQVGGIPEYHQHWIKVANDFDKQRKMPGIRAGRTSLYWRSKFYTVNRPAYIKRSVRLPIWNGFV